MPSAQTRIRTENAGVYLARLTGHLAKLAGTRRFPGHSPRMHAGGEPPAVLHVEQADDAATITVSWGQLTLHATAGELMIRADAASQEHLVRLKDMAAGRLRKFGRREDLDIQWTATADSAGGN